MLDEATISRGRLNQLASGYANAASGFGRGLVVSVTQPECDAIRLISLPLKSTPGTYSRSPPFCFPSAPPAACCRTRALTDPL